MTPSQILPVQPEQRAVAMQAARYAFAGLLITIAFSACYWVVTEFIGLDPNLSLAIVFIVFTAISYLTHGAFSFRGHGGRDQGHIRATRFLLVNLIGFALNQAILWLLVKQLGRPTRLPVFPLILVAPWVTFSLHR